MRQIKAAKRPVLRSLVAAVLVGAAGVASAQSFPAKPIRVIVPWQPGSLDVFVRLMSPVLQADLGQPIIVETKPGATGFIGAEYVARAQPDGYTLLVTPGGSVVAAYLIAKDPPFNTLRDFQPITVLYTAPQAIVVKAALPVSNLREFLAYAKANPGKLSHASTGVGGAQHVDSETFRRYAGIDSVHVPYAGTTPAVQSLVSGQTDWGSLTLGNVKAQVLVGKLKLIAVHGGRAPSDVPPVPTLESVFQGFESVPSFIGLWAPSGTPQPVVSRLHGAAVKALRDPSVRSKTEEGGAVIGANTPEEFASIIKASMEGTARNINAARTAGVKFE